MKIRLKLFFALFVPVIIISFCGGRHSITVAGSTAFQPFVEKLADQYMKMHPDTSVSMQSGGSALGIQATISGAAHIGVADFVVLPPEAKQLSSVIVAKDGIAVIVNLKNSVKNLTFHQIRDIYSGRIKNWKDVGGANRSITVVSRETGSGTRSSFEAVVKDIKLKADVIIQDTNGTVRETVSNDAHAIGYVSQGFFNEKVKPVSVNGIAYTFEEITNGRYLLVRPVFFLTREVPQDNVKNFIDYILSKQGQDIIKQNGLIPVK